MSDLEHSDVDPQPAFERTEQLIRAKESEIVDMSRDRRFIETKNALYSIVEGPTWEIALVYAQYTGSIMRGKNFAIHGPHLSHSTIAEIESMGFREMASDLGKVAYIASTEMQISRNIDDFERPS